MSKEALVFITVDLVLETISNMLNIPKNKLQQYYDDSTAFRDYLNSITGELRNDAQNELFQVTPSTTPRFDIPWITEELKKKQDQIFNIKNQITELQIKARETENKTFNQALKELSPGNPFADAATPVAKLLFNNTFKKNKKKKINEYNKQAVQLANKAHEINKTPIRNTNPTYQSIQERRQNAQSKK